MGEFATFALSAGLNAAQQQIAAKRQATALEARRRDQVSQIQAKQAIEERRRREQLRRAQATQRARFAGSGLNPQSGSAASLISGLAKEVDRAIADARGLDNLTIDRINADANTRRRSLLEQSRSGLLGTFNDVAMRGIRTLNLLEP